MGRRELLTIIGTFIVISGATSASAVIVIDGTVDAEYGAPIAVQDTPTHFGNNFNELNAAYAKRDANGNVALMLTGNLEQGSPNGLILFIDSRAGGAVELVREDNYGILGSFGGEGGAAGRVDDWGTDIDPSANNSPFRGGGSILDPSFNPDVAIVINRANNRYYTDIIDMTLPNAPPETGPDDRSRYLGENLFTEQTTTAVSQTYTRGDANVAKGHNGAIEHVLNNTNMLGINGWNSAAPPGDLGDPLTATTGYEALFSAEFLANDGQPIRMMAFITNSGGNVLSNQFLGEAGGLHGSDNLNDYGGLGGVPLFDASLFTGNQFFTIPSSTGPDGDYNDDGVWDLRDYVLWRETDGSQDGYNAWKSNFGTGEGTASVLGSSSVVPEPTTIALVILGLAMAAGRRHR